MENHSSGDRSEAKYTAFSETDFGTVLCWGSNDVGTQVLPCVFHVVPAGKCVTSHSSGDRKEAKCTASSEIGFGVLLNSNLRRSLHSYFL